MEKTKYILKKKKRLRQPSANVLAFSNVNNQPLISIWRKRIFVKLTLEKTEIISGSLCSHCREADCFSIRVAPWAFTPRCCSGCGKCSGTWERPQQSWPYSSILCLPKAVPHMAQHSLHGFSHLIPVWSISIAALATSCHLMVSQNLTLILRVSQAHWQAWEQRWSNLRALDLLEIVVFWTKTKQNKKVNYRSSLDYKL